MSVFCSGFPKSGNHALQKAVELLGIPSEVNHQPFADGLPVAATHHVFIKRDPRNVIVSWLRWTNDAVTPGKFLSRFRRFDERLSLVEDMARYEGWLSAQATHVVRYEDLIADDRAIRGIADYLGTTVINGAWHALPNHTRTWNAERSDYRTIWCPEVEAAWNAEGGRELLERWGYAGH